MSSVHILFDNNGDCNTLKSTGLYYTVSAKNTPEATNGMLEVFANNAQTMVFQRFTRFQSNRVFTRTYYVNAWSGWLQI